MARGHDRPGPPQPPRTPSPPSIIEPADRDSDDATSLQHRQQHQHSSPCPANVGGNLLSADSLLRVPSPTFLLAPDMASDAAHQQPNGAGADGGHNPFNFQTQIISTSPVKSNVGQRRGHRYKHSSISAQHQIFQEPPQRAPPVLPASLPVPTVREAWRSTSREQRARLYWCLCHAAVAVYVFFSASGSLAMTALSHLVFFDVGSAAICVAVDVLGNFEVWRRSSIRHPFGLQRAEVLAGFAMSIFLVFGGFDLISHNLKHMLEPHGSHEPVSAAPGSSNPGSSSHAHSSHPRGATGHGVPRVEPGAIDPASLAAIVATLISAYGLKNHGRIRRVMRVEYPPYLSSILPGILSNPFHFLTLLFSFIMLLLPAFSVGTFVWLDRLVCAAIAVSMFVLGSRLAVAQGLMLLMSYRGRAAGQQPSSSSTIGAKSALAPASGFSGVDGSTGKDGVSAVVREIEAEPHITRVEEAQFWQVHYGLCMANLKVCVAKGCDDGALSQLRGRVTRLVQNRLGEGYGRGGSLRWEVTLQMSTDPRS